MRRPLVVLPFMVAAVVGATGTWALYRFAWLLDQIDRADEAPEADA